MGLEHATTIVEALAALPRGEARGYTFRGVDGSERYYCFEAVEREARQRAARYANAGLNPGDRVALVVADPAEFVLSFLGAVIGGFVPVPIYPRASFKARNAYVDTVGHIARAAGARALLTMEATLAVLEPVTAAPDGPEKVLVLERFLEGEAPTFEPPEIAPDDPCFLQFTSGSTSMPKGVVVTHRNLVQNARDFLGPHGLDRRPEDVGLSWLPLYHDMGLIGFMLGTLVCDIPTYFVPTEAFARRPGMWLELISEKRATITFAPNFGYALATKRARDRDLAGLDLSCVRIAGCGAEPINPDVMRAFADRFRPAGFDPGAWLPCYGMAEATLAITFTKHGGGFQTDRVDASQLRRRRATPAGPDADGTVELVSCGSPFPSTSLSIVDGQGRACGERQVGEVVVRGPGVTPGYFNNPEATEAAFRDGTLCTGDLGYVADGQLYICGRQKDLIIIRGANLHPQDIEWSVAEVPGVRRDNVVAFSSLIDGEEQLVIAAEGNSKDAPELRKSVATRVAERHSLKVAHVAVVRLGSLPKTSSGKVQRRRTRELFEDGQLEEHGE